MVGRTFRAGEFSRQWFYAPAGTTISGLSWSGRPRSENCNWATELRAVGPNVTVLGTRGTPGSPGCNSPRETAYQNPIYIGAPAGTTALMQNVQCAAGSCASGATMHTFYAAVVVNDPSPPGLSVAGGGLSGRSGWVRGRQALTVSASDNTGIRNVSMRIDGASSTVDSPKPCNARLANQCAAGNGTTSLATRTADYRDGPHKIVVSAYDAAGNATTRSATARFDNTAPPPPSAVLEGGSGWRASNAFTTRWGSPEAPSANRAPITAVRYQVCPAGSVSGCARTRTVSEDGPTDVSAKVPGEGQWDLRIALVDAAGNGSGSDARWSAPIRLRHDPVQARLRAGITKIKVKRKRVRSRGKLRIVRRRVTSLVESRRLGYGRRFTVRGQLLTATGQARPNVPVEIYSRPSQIDGQEAAVGVVRTDGRGRFEYISRARRSRTLRFTYRANTAVVRVKVPARVRFAVRPRSVINGESVALRGRVLGRIPVGGKQVVIQAYSRGKWRSFQLLRTDNRGRFNYLYRFDGTRGTVKYPLRAVATKELTFPFEGGVSRVRRVTVRGL